MEEVRNAVHILATAGCKELIIFQCTTDYPSRLEEANLRVIGAFHDAFGVPIGYSDHSEGLLATTAAVALGACAIERHFTLDRKMPGPDHLASSDPAQMRSLVETVRNVELACGSATKTPSAREMSNKENMRRGLVAARKLPSGHRLEEPDIAFKRPLHGIAPDQYRQVLGRQLTRDLEADEPVSWDDLE